MSTNNPNTSLLQSSKSTPSDTTPAPLTGPSSAVSFEFQKVPPPSLLYIQRDDVLVLQAATSQAGEVVNFNVRILQPNGRVEETQIVLRPASTRVVLTQTQVVSEGYLLSLAAQSTASFTRGQTFARASISRAIFGGTQAAQVIFADYVTAFISSGYPNGRILAPSEGPGYVYGVTISQPAAGSDWSVSVPVNARWRLRAWGAIFTTSAVVANRIVGATISGSAGNFWRASAVANAVASNPYRVTAGGIVAYVGLDTLTLTLPLPPDMMLAGPVAIGHQFGSVTVNIQAADQWSNINALVEEWIDNV
jgi:hypothetical protein